MSQDIVREAVSLVGAMGVSTVYFIGLRKQSLLMAGMAGMIVFMVILSLLKAGVDYFYASDWWKTVLVGVFFVIFLAIPIVVTYCVNHYDNKVRITHITKDGDIKTKW